MKIFKRLLAFILTFTLAVPIVPFSVKAEKENIADTAITEAPLEIGESETTGEMSFPGLLTDELSKKTTYAGESSILDLVIDGQVAIVTYQTSTIADLVVAIYDEDTEQMLASGAAVATKETREISIPIKGTIPTTFIARAYLLDCEEHTPLCDVYTAQQYTRAMKELQILTTEDFSEELVLNLDDNTETNFGIYSESTIQVTESSQINILTDNGDNTYTIRNADRVFTELQSGDSFSYEYDDGTILLIKVRDIIVDDDTVTIIAESETDLSDFFDYIKIDADSYGCAPVVDDSTLDEGVTRSESEIALTAVEDEGSFAQSVSFTLNKTIHKSDNKAVTLKGKLTLGYAVKLKFYLALEYQYLSLDWKNIASVKVDFSGKVDMLEIPLCRISLPILPGIEVGFTPAFVVEVSGSISWEGELSYGLIVTYDSKSKPKFASTYNKPTTESEVKFEGQLFIGIQAEPYTAIINAKLCKASLKVSGGIELSAEKKLLSSNRDILHECSNCYDGKLYSKLSASFTVNIIKGVVNEEIKVAEFKKKLSDFYYSDDYHEFGFTTCPHIRYKVTIIVLDDEAKPVKDVKIRGTGLDEAPITDDTGKAVFYLANGEYKLSAICSMGVQNEDLVVKNQKKELTITIPALYRVYVTVLDENGNPIPNVTILGTGLDESPITNEVGKTVFQTKRGKYILTAKNNSYSGSAELLVENKDVELTITVCSMLQEGVIDSGKFGKEGDNLSWILYDNGTLIITGIGEMEDMEGSTGNNYKSPWSNWKDKIVAVKIESGVTTIGEFAFKNCSAIASIEFPEGIMDIGIYAFWGCTALISITIPDTITSINTGVFCDCSSLTNIIIPNSITTIGNSAFSGCTNLTSVTIPESVIKIDVGAFSSCTNLTSITIPKYVTRIGADAFSGSGLTNIYFLGDGPFFGNRCFKNVIANAYYPQNNSTWSGGLLGNMGDYGGTITWIPYNPLNESVTEQDIDAARNVDDKTSFEDYLKEEPNKTIEELSPIDQLSESNFKVDDASSEIEIDYKQEGYKNAESLENERTDVFENLIPGDTYVMVAAKSLDDTKLFAADNLLYIAQMDADENGFVILNYIPRTSDSSIDVCIYGTNQVPIKPQNGIETIPEGLWIADLSEEKFTYTGTAIKPNVRVYDHKTLLIENTDYTIRYKNNIKVNDATIEKTAPTITVTGKGNYSGKETVTFKILPLDISGAAFEADDLSVLYNAKKNQQPTQDLLYDGKKLKRNIDYSIIYYDSTGETILDSVKGEGNYYIEFVGKGNYTGTRRINLAVVADLKLMGKVSVARIANQVYTGKSITPALMIKNGKDLLVENRDYTVRYRNNIDIGTAYALVTGIGSYSGTKRVTFKITGTAIKKAVVSGLSNQMYGGVDIKPDLQLSIKLNSLVTKSLTEGTDYTVSWQKNQNAGTATVIFKGINGYTGTLKRTFKIQAFNINTDTKDRFKIMLESESVPYAKGGSKPMLNITFRDNDGMTHQLEEGTDYTLSYKNNTSVNTGIDVKKIPTVIIKGKGNFSGSKSLNYKITAQNLGNLQLEVADKTYQEKANIYSTKIIVTDLNGKTLDSKRDYEKTVIYTYKNDTMLGDMTIRNAGAIVEKTDIIPAGTVIVVTVSGKGNYKGSLSGEYRIVKANISSASITIPAQIYTGKEIILNEDDIMVKKEGNTLDSSQYEIISGSYKNNIKKGTANVTVRGLDNYGGTKVAKFKIKAKGFMWWWRDFVDNL